MSTRLGCPGISSAVSKMPEEPVRCDTVGEHEGRKLVLNAKRFLMPIERWECGAAVQALL